MSNKNSPDELNPSGGLNPPNGGYLIAIEGIDGSGKSSLAIALEKSLKKNLPNKGILLTKEPGDSQLGKKLRVLLHEEKEHICDKAEYLLFAADRAQHFEELVMPALQKGTIIISDRLGDSSIAYQGFGRGLDVDMITKINQWAMQNIKPNIIFYIKLDFKIALPRIMQRGHKLTSFETEEELFFKRVSDGFENIFKNKSNVVTLDGKKSIKELTEEATNILINRLNQ